MRCSMLNAQWCCFPSVTDQLRTSSSESPSCFSSSGPFVGKTLLLLGRSMTSFSLIGAASSPLVLFSSSLFNHARTLGCRVAKDSAKTRKPTELIVTRSGPINASLNFPGSDCSAKPPKMVSSICNDVVNDSQSSALSTKGASFRIRSMLNKTTSMAMISCTLDPGSITVI